MRALVFVPDVLRGRGLIEAGKDGSVLSFFVRGGEAVEPLLFSSLSSENDADVDLLFQISGRGGEAFCSRKPSVKTGSGVFLCDAYWSFAGV